MNLNQAFAPVAAMTAVAFLTVAAPKAEAATVAHFNASGVIGPSSSPFSVTADFDLTAPSEIDFPTLTLTSTALDNASFTVGTTTYSSQNAQVAVTTDSSASSMTIIFEDIDIVFPGNNGSIDFFRFDYSSSPVSILDNASYVEGFTTLADGSFGSPVNIEFVYDGGSTYYGTISSHSVTIIPEPSFVGLSLLTASTLLLRRRRDGGAQVSEPETQTLAP